MNVINLAYKIFNIYMYIRNNLIIKNYFIGGFERRETTYINKSVL